MSRSYKGVRLKKNRVYTVEDLRGTYKVDPNTISNWVKAGLQPSDSKKPYVFRGAVVTAFHEERRMRKSTQLRPGEFKCGSCNAAVFPDAATVESMIVGKGTHMFSGRCSDCDVSVMKISSQADRDYFAGLTNPNTPVDSRHEEKGAVPGGIGSKSEIDLSRLSLINDRIIYRWQTYAGRHSEKTIDRHLAAIRLGEELMGGKAFDQLTTRDIAKVRDYLKQCLVARDDTAKSQSTVSHTASHLADFLIWLLKQDGHKRLQRDLPDYLKLPKAAYAAALPRPSKAYPDLDEAEALLSAMPSKSIMHRRARAIFAIAFLGGLRAETIVSLRLCHFDAERKVIVQDATVVRAKNGKSNIVNWFPIADGFKEEVQRWVASLRALGCHDGDALFPSEMWLGSPRSISATGRVLIEPMATPHAVAEAFRIACRAVEQKYSPHSAKHTLAFERDRRPLTSIQRKAWSDALGHENEATTERHYGKLSDERRYELFEEMGEAKISKRKQLTDEDKIALFDGLLNFINEN
ncbi:tyrosine-type recombinase/integrase [Loktanella sp. M215]|uniref:tyrosine-type recombinase/integrase n=1 Tax=Loktanella sp. M215 TaxID=2675431 RepID=UPI001F00007C|nr:tyrosine-type recombinase/integrase [Loktanella sp. M215]